MSGSGHALGKVPNFLGCTALALDWLPKDICVSLSRELSALKYLSCNTLVCLGPHSTSGHDATSETLALDITLPAATQLRQHALGLHLRRALPGAYSDAGAGIKSGAGGSEAPWAPGGFVTDLKTAVRLTLGAPLSAKLGMQLASNAPVRLQHDPGDSRDFTGCAPVRAHLACSLLSC